MSVAWALFALYLVVTAGLAWKGGQKTGGAASYAIGDGNMNPWLVGVTLGACLASSSTFVIMPGFVYAEGLPALIGFTLPFVGGIAVGLYVLAPRFQAHGERTSALTIPHWLGARYDSPVLRRLFAGLNVLQLAYIVLVTVGCGYVMEQALGVPYQAAVVLVVLFVFGYTGFGGTWAHALTNSAQGAVMAAMALVIFGSGWRFWMDGSVLATLAPTGLVAPGSKLFSTAGEVWGVSFLMGLALTTQPHLLTKALYVRGSRPLRTVIGVGIATYALFCLVLFAGAYARIALPAGLPQDQVMARYLAQAFTSDALGACVSVAILAASMSTLDGLLVAISASVGNDLFPGRGGVWANRVVLAVLAALTIGAALWPPSLVLILGQLGVYGLVAASAGPLVVGLFSRERLPPGPAVASAVAALVVHFGAALSGSVENPGLAAALAIAVALPIAAVGALRAAQPAVA